MKPLRGAGLATMALLLPATLFLPQTRLAASTGNSAATITGSFSDSCRRFVAHSSKRGTQVGRDISYVELRYADGRVVRDEAVGDPDYSIDGGTGDEISVAIVKSGTTIEQFDCEANNGPPIAVLEVKLPAGCVLWFADTNTWACPLDTYGSEATVWRDVGIVGFGCEFDPSLCSVTLSFRGTSSADPANDITSWSIDLGDGTSVSGDWTTHPPTEIVVPMTWLQFPRTVTLTVTDSTGQSSADTIVVFGDHQD